MDRDADQAQHGKADTDAHPERHYIVFFRDAAWQYTYRGSITGPFADRDEAVATAVAAARQSAEANAEVIVQELDMRQETVWRPGAD